MYAYIIDIDHLYSKKNTVYEIIKEVFFNHLRRYCNTYNCFRFKSKDRSLQLKNDPEKSFV